MEFFSLNLILNTARISSHTRYVLYSITHTNFHYFLNRINTELFKSFAPF